MNNNLSSDAKVLYGLIMQYQEDGVCYETNEFFARFFINSKSEHASVRTIQNYKQELKKENLIVQFKKGTKIGLWIVNSNDCVNEEAEKIGAKTDCVKLCLDHENIFTPHENKQQKLEENAQNANYTKCFKHLVLVSKENKNYNNISARTHTHAREEVDNPSIFANYDSLHRCNKVPAHTESDRKPYTLLFKSFFEYYTQGPLHDAAIEIIDTMIEAVKGCNYKQGFRFNYIEYNKQNPVEDIILNLTEKEFAEIVATVGFKQDIENRAAYIFGAIVQCGRTLTWKKVDTLVRKGWPWSEWVPTQTNKKLANLVFNVQRSVEIEKRNLQLKQDLEMKQQRTETVGSQ